METFAIGQVGLGQRSYDPADGLELNRGSDASYLIALPYSRGRLRLEREGTVLHDGAVRPGMVRVVAPHERTSMAARSRFEAVTLRVPSETFHAAWGTGRAEAIRAAGREVERLCPAFVSALGIHGRRRDLVVGGLTSALIGLMLEGGTNVGRKPRAGLTELEFELAENYAAAHLREGVELKEWAAAVDLEAKVFGRRFAEYTGSPPYAWFMDRRVNEAMRLLTTTDLPIVTVALEMGFASQSHFTDAFRRRTGVAPGAFRSASRDPGSASSSPGT